MRAVSPRIRVDASLHLLHGSRATVDVVVALSADVDVDGPDVRGALRLLTARAQAAAEAYFAGLLASAPPEPDGDHLAELTEACERATTTWMPAVSVHAVRWALAELERLQVERDAAVGQVRLAHEFLGALRAAPPERKAGR